MMTMTMMDMYQQTIENRVPEWVPTTEEEEQAILDEYNTELRTPAEPEETEAVEIYDPEYDYYMDEILEGEQASESNAYGLEDEYKQDFEEWKYNYEWFGKTFQEWIQEKQAYWEEVARETEENWRESYTDRSR